VLNTNGSFTYDPALNFNGSDSFTYTVTDAASGESLTRSVAITVGQVNDLGTFGGATSATTAEDTPVSGTLTFTDVADGFSPTNFAVTTAATNGTAAINPISGAWTYTPAANFFGSDNFTVSVVDSDGNPETQVISITVTAANDPTVITGDTSGTGAEDGAAITGDLNATDGDGLTDGTYFTVSGPATNGTAAIDATTGAWTYTPALNFNGSDSFTVTVTDDLGNTATQLITLTVTPTVDLTAGNDSFPAAIEDTQLTGSVATNDSTTSTGTLTYAVATGPANGVLVLNTNGSFTYDPALNFNGSDSFTYTVTDAASGESLTRSVAITITADNDAPVVSGPVTLASIVEDSSGVVITASQLLANASDSDVPVQALSVTGLTLATPLAGTLSGSGPWTFIPTPNYNGPVSFTYSVSDSIASVATSATMTVLAGSDPDTVDIDQTLDPDSLTLSGFLTVGTGIPGTNFVVATDPVDALGVEVGLRADLRFTGIAPRDPADLSYFDLSNPPTFYVPAGPALGTPNDNIGTPTDDTWARWNYTLSINADTDNNGGVIGDRQYVFILKNVTTNTILANVTFEQALTAAGATPVQIAFINGSSLFQDSINFEPSFGPAFDPSAAGTYTVEIIARDRSNGSDLIANKIEVVVNHAPVANTDTVAAVEDTPITYSASQLLSNDTDADGNTLFIDSVASVSGGTVVLNLDGTVSFTPVANFNGQAFFTYIATDGKPIDSDSLPVTVTVNVASVNDSPVAINDSIVTVEDTLVNGDVLIANPTTADSDVDSGSLTVAVVTPPANGILVLNPTGTFTYTPNSNFNGTDTFTYKANDGSLDSNIATVTITVTAFNDAPVAVNDLLSVASNAVTNFGVLGNDTDVDGGPLTITHVNGSAYTPAANITLANGMLNFTVATGVYNFVYIPDSGFVGIETFNYTINDGVGGVSTATVTLNVVSTNNPPVAVDDTGSGNKNTSISGNVLTNDSDPDLDSLTALLLTSTSNGMVSLLADGSFNYTPNTNYVGMDSFTYRVIDGRGGIATATVNLTIDPANSAPTVVSQSFSTAENSLAGTVIGTATASDLDGNALTYSLTGTGASNFTINPTTGQITVSNSAALDFETTPVYNLTLNVNDGTVIGTAALTINITNVVDEVAPRVKSVRVNSTGWTTRFRNFANNSVNGPAVDGTYIGYEIPTGSSAQTLTLPWVNINQLQVQFTEDVGASLGLADFRLTGIAGLRADLATGTIPTILSYSYNATDFIATLTLNQSIEASKIDLEVLAAGVFDASGNRLDGEWVNNSASYTFLGSSPTPTNSGNGVAGGDFSFRMHVLPGDTNRTGDEVTLADQTTIDSAPPLNGQLVGNTNPAPTGGYSIFFDINGSNVIDTFDVIGVRNRNGSKLL
jgi:large repetitive protein